MSACPACRRRAWLLGALNARLEYSGRDPARLAALLELPDEQLIRDVGGGESESLLESYAGLRFERSEQLPTGTARICRHDARYPNVLAGGAGAPRLLHVAGGLERLRRHLAAPSVAIVGARGASDYGLEVAHGLARDLAAGGVTVLSGLAEGVAAAAHAGALEAGGPTLTVAAGGIDVCHPASRQPLYARLHSAGCVLAELPCGVRPRSWCHTARARIVVALARVVVVVEAGERPSELLHARLAQGTDRIVAAVPGRVSAPLSRGTHALLREGAVLVRDPQDVRDVLGGASVRTPASHRSPQPSPRDALAPPLRKLLDEVAGGRDTVAKLLAAGAPERETLNGLAHLELSGALVRGDAGRYVARL